MNGHVINFGSGSFDALLVCASLVIAFSGSFAALDLAV